uniref:Uncharacterized protein n=1 Tax=Nothobranchius furzeri TaxID=105023 RepID=A0A1A7ZCY2_NOTFU
MEKLKRLRGARKEAQSDVQPLTRAQSGLKTVKKWVPLNEGGIASPIWLLSASSSGGITLGKVQGQSCDEECFSWSVYRPGTCANCGNEVAEIRWEGPRFLKDKVLRKNPSPTNVVELHGVMKVAWCGDCWMSKAGKTRIGRLDHHSVDESRKCCRVDKGRLASCSSSCGVRIYPVVLLVPEMSHLSGLTCSQAYWENCFKEIVCTRKGGSLSETFSPWGKVLWEATEPQLCWRDRRGKFPITTDEWERRQVRHETTDKDWYTSATVPTCNDLSITRSQTQVLVKTKKGWKKLDVWRDSLKKSDGVLIAVNLEWDRHAETPRLFTRDTVAAPRPQVN